MARLRLYRRGKWIATHDLQVGTSVAGRDDDCDLVLKDPSTSRRHFQVILDEERKVLLQDLESENGTFVDGVQEFSRRLAQRSVIQVGEELILFEPDGQDGAAQVGTDLPRWAVTNMEQNPEMANLAEAPPTRAVPPAWQRRAQAAERSRMRPHLLMKGGRGDQIFALDTRVTPIGLGAVSVSVGPAARAKVLAEVVRVSEGAFVARAKGLLGKIEVNGESTRKKPLSPGDRITVAGQTLVYRLGIEDEEAKGR
jgi:hypothetical protein